MYLTASDIFMYFCPSKCPLRIVLKAEGITQAEAGPCERVLRELGRRHERACLAKFSSVLDLSEVPLDQRLARTRQEVARCTSVLYQGALSAEVEIGGAPCVILGIPDLLILDSNNRHRICGCKLARDIDEHPEVRLQLGLYGWLYAQSFQQAPSGLDIYSGTGEIIPIDYDGGQEVLALLEEIVRLKRSGTRPYCPVGWSKCSACSFEEYCWQQAQDGQDVAIISGIDQGLAVALHDRGVTTVQQLLDAFDVGSLSRLQRPWGTKQRRVGQSAGRILQMAQALASGREILLCRPVIPKHASYAMFDLEGLPPQMDAMEKIYLWGFQVFGTEPGPYMPAVAGFGPDGDREGWLMFLQNACNIFQRYGDIPFVHWHSYERAHLDMYIERYGDPDGIAARVRQNLLDLLPITRDAIALPLPSYSLKVVERYIGFERSQQEYGGNWAIAKYIEACQAEDTYLRQETMAQILKYNEEDLAATWAVLQWLQGKAACD